jgi:hypothetical protein
VGGTPFLKNFRRERIMRKTMLFVMTCLILIFVNSGLALTVPFFDNFNTENGGVYTINYNNFKNWTITGGTVDLIGTGSPFNFFPSHGLYVDMDGSTFNPGTMLSSSSFALQPGTYKLSFELAGNQRSSTTDQVTVQIALGTLLNKTYNLSTYTPFTLFTETIIVPQAMNASLSFKGTGSDNNGMLLDNISFDVPEPATIALLGLGAFLLRRKNK